MNTCGLRRILPHLFPQVPPRSPLVINAYYYAYKRGVTGSNPVAPTRSEGIRDLLARHAEDAIYFAADKNRYIGAASIGFGPDGKRVRRCELASKQLWGK
jgi:hypothetical protein